jgi:hypothetical protein
MTPIRKFHISITIITVALMVVVLSGVIPWLESKQSTSAWISMLVGVGGSTAIYTAAAKLLVILLEHVRWLKKFFLGKDDLQGTWIGTYVNVEGERIYTVEHFEQDLENLAIKGKGFNRQGDVTGEWNSITSAIDSVNKKLIYAYTCDRYKELVQFQGVCVFALERPTSTRRPMTIHGYSADLTEGGKKTENREIRIDDNFLDMKKAFIEAVKRCDETNT